MAATGSSSPDPTDSVRRVLVVEGDETGLKALVLLLGRAGYDVLGVSDPAAARECLNTETFDAVVVDLELPGEQWRQIVELARDRDEESVPRVVGVSVRGSRPAAGKLHDLDARLSKPLDLRALYAFLGPGSIRHR